MVQFHHYELNYKSCTTNTSITSFLSFYIHIKDILKIQDSVTHS